MPDRDVLPRAPFANVCWLFALADLIDLPWAMNKHKVIYG